MKRKRESVSANESRIKYPIEEEPVLDELKYKAQILAHLINIGSAGRTREYTMANTNSPDDEDEARLRDIFNDVFIQFFPEDAYIVDSDGNELRGGKTRRNRRRHSRRSLKHKRKYKYTRRR